MTVAEVVRLYNYPEYVVVENMLGSVDYWEDASEDLATSWDLTNGILTIWTF